MPRKRRSLRELLDETGIGVVAASRKSGLSRAYLYDLFDGKSEPSVAVVMALTIALNVTVDESEIRASIAESQRRAKRRPGKR